MLPPLFETTYRSNITNLAPVKGSTNQLRGYELGPSRIKQQAVFTPVVHLTPAGVLVTSCSSFIGGYLFNEAVSFCIDKFRGYRQAKKIHKQMGMEQLPESDVIIPATISIDNSEYEYVE